MLRGFRWGAIVFGALLASACSSSGGDGPAVCSTDSTWNGGDEESPLMHPGGDCIGCHETKGEGEAPKFVIAGTVMGATDDDTDCNGESGVTVEITDANGQVLTLTTNKAGNFYVEEKQASSFAFPFTAKVKANGKEAAMSTPQSTGACNTCHTPEGASGAPGRITVPK